MGRFLVRSSNRPRETKLIQRATLHPIAGEVENITHVITCVSMKKRFIEHTYFDKLNLRWYRSITLFDDPITLPQTGPTQTANQWHTLNNSQRYLRPTSIPKITFVSTTTKKPPIQIHATNSQSYTPLFRAG